MLAVAERLLHGLLAAPLHVPFTALAEGRLIPAGSSCSQTEEPSPDNPPQSLLTAAMLSHNGAMLARVLQWGRTHGRPAGFAWAWDAVDGTGASPAQILQGLPAKLKEQLLEDPDARQALLAQLPHPPGPLPSMGSEAPGHGQGPAECSALEPAGLSRRLGIKLDASAKPCSSHLQPAPTAAGHARDPGHTQPYRPIGSGAWMAL